jgi:hypothetical protein
MTWKRPGSCCDGSDTKHLVDSGWAKLFGFGTMLTLLITDDY